MLLFHSYFSNKAGEQLEKNPHDTPKPFVNAEKEASRLLQLLLWAELVGVSALLLAAVGGTWWEAGVALAADHLVAVELGGQGLEGWLNETTTEAEDQVEGRLLKCCVLAFVPSLCRVSSPRTQAALDHGLSLSFLFHPIYSLMIQPGPVSNHPPEIMSRTFWML